MKHLLWLLLLALAGCQTYGGMSAEQISAASKDKSASCVYAKILGVWGSGETTVVAYDQKTIFNGGIQIGDKCSSLTATDTKPGQPVVTVPAPPKPATP